jgi:hypothetical protein
MPPIIFHMPSITSLIKQKANELRVDVSKIPPYAIAGVKDYDMVCKKLKEAGKEYPNTRPQMWFTHYAVDDLTDEHEIGGRLNATAALIENGNTPISHNQMQKVIGTTWISAPIVHEINGDGTAITEVYSTKGKSPFLEKAYGIEKSSGWIPALELFFLGDKSVEGLSSFFQKFPPEKNREYYLSTLEKSVEGSLKLDGSPRKGQDDRVQALREAIENISKEWKK